MTLSIGVDVGGTKILAGVVDEEGKVLVQTRRPTPTGSSVRTAAAIADIVSELRRDHEVASVGIGVAGFVDAAGVEVVFAANLGWRNVRIGDEVAELIAMPVIVENDANAGAWGEARFGGGRGLDNLVVVTVGTGIGGGIIFDGELFRGKFGMGGEIGHFRLVPDGRRCGCGNRGCWEQYASGRALVREARELVGVSPRTPGGLLDRAGTTEGIQGPLISQAAQEGDELAMEAFTEVGMWLGRGLAELAAILDPGCFLIGGGVSEAGPLLLDPALHWYTESLTGRGHRPFAELRTAELGNEAGLVGAADLARLKL